MFALIRLLGCLHSFVSLPEKYISTIGGDDLVVKQNSRTRKRTKGHVPLSLRVLRVFRARIYFAYP